ncbi:hypothetical protein IV203_038768 [Nitzschia inconspicua]|uniref:Uncharacterized protein n=1 Tax=Nitzschia inconspicua TaxID=303405 RepID=A0A9K3Q232_9STRA|nr:hypothetical protein IV203_038768 [Nitzschia inconspicua]
MAPVLLSTFRPRTLIDMRVGKFHTVQLLVHIRQQDWKWYQENAVEITEEFQELMQERVLPRMVGTELEDYYRTKHTGVLPPLEEELGDNSSSSKVVASKNNKLGGGGKKRETTTSTKGRGKNVSKGAGGTVSSTSKATAKNSKKRKGISLLQLLQDNNDGSGKKPEKDVYFSFGDIIQLSYRKEPALSYKTIFFQKSQQDDPSKKKSIMNTTSFRDYHRLSHRLLIWISKLDPDQKTNPDPKGVGFYRPELIPISNLFRPPAELDLDDDDDDDN